MDKTEAKALTDNLFAQVDALVGDLDNLEDNAFQLAVDLRDAGFDKLADDVADLENQLVDAYHDLKG
jgi:hypothetical protein